MPDGYRETISDGVDYINGMDRRFVANLRTREESLSLLKEAIDSADHIVLGAGAGVSTSAGFTYSGERFKSIFPDFIREYGITDMYSGGFYPFPDKETYWAWWSRHIYFNRYIEAPVPVYKGLMSLLKDKDFFVVTTNVDHQFQMAGIDRERLFYTQGDYGLFQSTNPKNRRTYDNEKNIREMLEYQGFIEKDGVLAFPPEGAKMRVASDMIPRCPDDGMPMTMNLRSDDTFAEDEGWRRASAAYSEFLSRCKDDKTLYLEAGVGSNTPVIIKYPFWQRTSTNPNATYACLNYGETYCPRSIADRSICVDGDLWGILKDLENLD